MNEETPIVPPATEQPADTEYLAKRADLFTKLSALCAGVDESLVCDVCTVFLSITANNIRVRSGAHQGEAAVEFMNAKLIQYYKLRANLTDKLASEQSN